MNMQRREFLKTGGLAGGALGLNLLGSLGLPNNLFADGHSSNKKMLFIFQRGGNDGINAVIPRGDNEYNTTNRPTLFLRENQALDLGNGFAQLHPGLEPMMEIFNNQKLNGQDGPGNLAVIHRVGYAGQSRSHFNSQHYWENATPGDKKLDEGMFYRQITETLDLTDEANAFVAASLSGSQMVSLRGPKPLPNFRKASDFAFRGSTAQNRKFLGTLPGADPRWPTGSGVLGLYGGRPNLPGNVTVKRFTEQANYLARPSRHSRMLRKKPIPLPIAQPIPVAAMGSDFGRRRCFSSVPTPRYSG